MFQIVLSFFLIPHAQAQVSVDTQRPFNQGQVIEVPGAAEYLGDIPQDIEWIFAPSQFHTMAGLTTQRVGWAPNFVGIHTGSPGLMFEGIPYPFLSTTILNWMPVYQNVELLDFPASAWWGPFASMGAVQIRLPEFLETSNTTLGAWEGSGGIGGGEGAYRDSRFSLAGNFQHGYLNNSASTDAFNLLSGAKWMTGDPFEIRTGFLGTEWLGRDRWYSLFGSLEWKSPNFQSLEWKPFVQFAVSNGLGVQEFGSDINYHFSMAGLVESQVGLGLSHDNLSEMTSVSSLDRGYIQNFDVIDILGDFKLNLAFRFDFSNVTNTVFSTTLGSQYRLGEVMLLGNYSKGVDQFLTEEIQQGEAGVRYQPSDEWALTCKYLYDQVGNDYWNGGRAVFQWSPGGSFFGIFRKVDVNLSEQILIDPTGTASFDTGGRVQWSFLNPVEFWLGGRVISGQDFFTEGGVNWTIVSGYRLYISVENAGNFPVSWPDPTASQGRVVWFGAEAGF